MKNFTTTLSVSALAVILAFASCKKEPEPVEPVTPTPSGPSAEAQLKAYFLTNRENMKQSFTKDASTAFMISGTKGTTLNFTANSFETQSGAAVTGNVNIDLIEIFDKGDMVLANAQTMANTFGGGIEPLISGGELFVEVSQNGSPLRLKNSKQIYINVPSFGVPDPAMGLFYGDESRGSDTLVWDQADSARVQGTTSGYMFFSDSLRWINCDYFYSNPNPKTNVTAVLPSGFTNKTCKLYISFDGMKSVTSFYKYANGKYMSFSPYKLPIGLAVNFIAVAKINGTTHASITPSTITNNIEVTLNTLSATTDAQLKTDINNLP